MVSYFLMETEFVPVIPTDVSMNFFHEIDKWKQKRNILQLLLGLSLSVPSNLSLLVFL